MSYYMGIDLGSTTCKVVIIGENKEIISKGITNTRSNYTVATRFAEQEAIIMARFYFLEKVLRENVSKTPGIQVDIEKLLLLFELSFRLHDYKEKVVEMCEISKSLTKEDGSKLSGIITDIYNSIYQEAGQVITGLSFNKGVFFRDLISSSFMKHLKNIKDSDVFDRIIGYFDKSLLMIENKFNEIDFVRTALITLNANIINNITDYGNGAIDLIKVSIEEAGNYSFNIENKVGTGYGRQRLPFPKDKIQSEILCHGMGAHQMFPETRTVLDIGGQDTKAIRIDKNGVVTSFAMNDRCAAGCGRFLGYIADELNIGLQDLGPLALEAKKNVKISSTCTVFAGVELRDRLSLGERRSDILSGLHKAIVRRAVSLIARAGGVENEFTFTGGVAKNVSVDKYLRDIISKTYGNIVINISPDSIYVGSLGAALYAKGR